VAWFTDRHFFLLAVAVYGLSTVYSVFLWRKGFRKDDHVNYLLLLAAFLLHTVAMVRRGFSINHCPVNNLFEATVFIAWSAAAAYLVIGLLPQAAVSRRVCVAGAVHHRRVCADARRWTRRTARPRNFSGALTQPARGDHPAGLRRVRPRRGGGGHVPDQQHDLKFHKLRAVLSLLPPIQRLEIVTSRLVLAGFSFHHRP
jgi:hypothetical protein